MIQSEPVLSPLMLRAVHILLTLLQLRLPAAWKSMQLSVVMLWNAAVQSGAFLTLFMPTSINSARGICLSIRQQYG